MKHSLLKQKILQENINDYNIPVLTLLAEKDGLINPFLGRRRASTVDMFVLHQHFSCQAEAPVPRSDFS